MLCRRVWLVFCGKPARAPRPRREALLKNISRHTPVAFEEQYRTLDYFQGVLASSPHGIAMSDTDGKILFVNETAARMFGFARPGRMIGTAVCDYLDVPDRGRARRSRRALIDGSPCRQVIYTARRRNGGRFTVEVSCAAVRDGQDRSGSLMFVLRDVSRQARMEAELQENQHFIERVVNTAPDGIYIYDYVKRRAVYANAAILAALGFLPGQTDERRLPQLGKYIHPDDIPRFRAYYRRIRVSRRKQVWDFECRYLRDGRWCWIHCRSSVFRRNSDGRASQVITTVKDVTERKTKEAQLKAYREKLRGLTMQLALVSEQERRSVAEYLHDHVAQALAAARIHLASAAPAAPLARADAAIDRSIGLIRSLMREMISPALYKLGFEAAVAGLADYSRRQYNVVFKVASDGSGDRLTGDSRIILFRVLRELCINVIKHARVREAFITIAGDARGVRIAVKDLGRGFDPAALDDARRASFGLFSIREQIKSLKGECVVRSVPGRGTEVLVSMPFGRRPTRRRLP